jgi:predicted alpha/beta hydrolase
MKSSLIVTCPDQRQLKVTQFKPDTSSGSIVIASAFGVAQSFYWPLAEYLSEQGYTVYCFDFRGTGSNEDMISDVFCLSEWATQDLETVLCKALGTEQPVHLIGHSVGGQILGLAPSSKKLKSAIFIAASAPYWKRWPRLADGLKIRVNAGFILPLVSKLYARFPSQKFGLGNQDLPSNAVRQWASWMGKPDYLFDESFGLNCSAYKEMNIPILSLAFSDDLLAPLENINHLLRYFENADCTIKQIKPKEIGAKHIGHTGFFKEKFKDPLWQDALYFLRKTELAESAKHASKKLQNDRENKNENNSEATV